VHHWNGSGTGRPSDTIRTWGTVPAYYGLDGILDDILVFDKALTAEKVSEHFSNYPATVPEIPPRPLPKLDQNPGRFGAFYTKLNYYPGWDDLWPVEQDPDVVVCFGDNPVKFIFWRGIRYGPCWVSENENWMADQSLETWGIGADDIEGCFEHMQDRHCRFSHVRSLRTLTPGRLSIGVMPPSAPTITPGSPIPRRGGNAGWMSTTMFIRMPLR